MAGSSSPQLHIVETSAVTDFTSDAELVARAKGDAHAFAELYRRYVSAYNTVDLRGSQVLPLAPLCGGLPPELAWPYLERAAAAAARAG